jgi:hypothetical protein
MSSAISYLLRYRWARFQKRIRLLFLGTKRYHKLTIPKDTFHRIKDHEMFIAAIQLGRLANSLLAITRIYTKVPDNGKLINAKDKLEVMLIFGSMVYEALLEFGRLSKTLSTLPGWNSHKKEVDFLNKERGDKHSMFRTLLYSVRNEVTFHFQKKAIVETLNDLKVANDVDFALGESTYHHDVVYGLVDNLILRHIATKEGSNNEIEVVYQKYIDYVGALSATITQVASDLVLEILGGVSKQWKGPIQNPPEEPSNGPSNKGRSADTNGA